MENKTALSSGQQEALLKTLKTRFAKNTGRHAGLDWAAVHARLETYPDKLWSVNEMEQSGGEPDVVGQVQAPDQCHGDGCRHGHPNADRGAVPRAAGTWGLRY